MAAKNGKMTEGGGRGEGAAADDALSGPNSDGASTTVPDDADLLFGDDDPDATGGADAEPDLYADDLATLDAREKELAATGTPDEGGVRRAPVTGDRGAGDDSRIAALERELNELKAARGRSPDATRARQPAAEDDNEITVDPNDPNPVQTVARELTRRLNAGLGRQAERLRGDIEERERVRVESATHVRNVENSEAMIALAAREQEWANEHAVYAKVAKAIQHAGRWLAPDEIRAIAREDARDNELASIKRDRAKIESARARRAKLSAGPRSSQVLKFTERVRAKPPETIEEAEAVLLKGVRFAG